MEAKKKQSNKPESNKSLLVDVKSSRSKTVPIVEKNSSSKGGSATNKEPILASKKPENLIKFQAADDQQIIEFDEEMAKVSPVLKVLIDTAGRDPNVPITIPNNVKFETFQKIIEFSKLNKPDQPDDLKSISPKEEEFMNSIKDSQDKLIELINAADCLAFDALLNVACKTMADKIKGKPINEIRNLFKIENNGGYTPQEEEAIDKENDFYDKDFTFY